MHILAINSGSSSIKFKLYALPLEQLLLSGITERIGEANCNSVFSQHHRDGEVITWKTTTPGADHTQGMENILAFLQQNFADMMSSLTAIGHRVVHGGEYFHAATLISDAVAANIASLAPMAPLHNPANLTGITIAQHHCPQLPQVAVFDTGFFQSLPPHAYRYALPDELVQQHHLRRYGFHGISHQHAANQAAATLQRPLQDLRMITLHLGNGASAAAISQGQCIDTSMGMTPLAGLVMGTRCGDIDPSIPFILAKNTTMSFDDIETLLNNNSGMQGLCGAKDMREVHQLADSGDQQAQLALKLYCYQIAKYIGAYYIALGGLDALVFTGGVGENDALIRQSVCQQVSVTGLLIDQSRNSQPLKTLRNISAKTSKVQVVIVPANEELEIARQTAMAIT